MAGQTIFWWAKPSRSVGWHRWTLALLAGLMLALAYPNWEWAGLAWVAPGMLLWTAVGQPRGTAFRLGYAGGLAFYLLSLHWLLYIPFPAGAISGWLALSAYCALYPAVWVWLSWELFPRSSASLGYPRRPLDWWDCLEEFESIGWWRRQLWCFQAAFLWVALEMTLGRLLTGFPWNFLGVSQYRILPLIQIAEITGVYGVSFVVAYFSVSLIPAGMILLRRATLTRSWLRELAPSLVVAAVVLAVGLREMAVAVQQPEPEKSITVALVQPSIPQRLIWDPAKGDVRFEKVIALSREVLEEEDPDLLVWPESSLPGLKREHYRVIADMIRSHQVWMVLGADDVERRPTGASEGARQFDYYNAAFLLDPEGEFASRYRKQRLVIFGEYIPFEDWLPFMKALTPIPGSLAAGERPVPFRMEELGVQTSVLICFEDLFPDLVRESTGPKTDFLLNLTNNGWFGESSAQRQHAANAVFRAIENRLPLIRCTNNGLTCWIDSRGALHEASFGPEGRRSIYQAGTAVFEIPLEPPPTVSRPTYYQRGGDWLGWAAMAITGLGLVVRVGTWFLRRPKP